MAVHGWCNLNIIHISNVRTCFTSKVESNKVKMLFSSSGIRSYTYYLLPKLDLRIMFSSLVAPHVQCKNSKRNQKWQPQSQRHDFSSEKVFNIVSGSVVVRGLRNGVIPYYPGLEHWFLHSRHIRVPSAAHCSSRTCNKSRLAYRTSLVWPSFLLAETCYRGIIRVKLK